MLTLSEYASKFTLECQEQIMISSVYLNHNGTDMLVFEHKTVEKSANPINSLVEKLQGIFEYIHKKYTIFLSW